MAFALLGIVLGAGDAFIDFAPTDEADWVDQIDELASGVMYITFISRNSTAELVFNDLSYPEKALAITFFVASIFTSMLASYIELFNFLAALTVYNITNRLHRVVYSRTDLNTRFLLTCYERMWTDVNKINEINSGVMLVVYVQIVLLLSSSSVSLMEYNNWVDRVSMFFNCILIAVTFILAAEANKKVMFG